MPGAAAETHEIKSYYQKLECMHDRTARGATRAVRLSTHGASVQSESRARERGAGARRSHTTHDSRPRTSAGRASTPTLLCAIPHPAPLVYPRDLCPGPYSQRRSQDAEWPRQTDIATCVKSRTRYGTEGHSEEEATKLGNATPRTVAIYQRGIHTLARLHEVFDEGGMSQSFAGEL